jgi:cholestenol delta-isomerase
MCWWAFTGLTHLLIEGPFVFTPDFFTKSNPNFFDEVCKLMSIFQFPCHSFQYS